MIIKKQGRDFVPLVRPVKTSGQAKKRKHLHLNGFTMVPATGICIYFASDLHGAHRESGRKEQLTFQNMEQLNRIELRGIIGNVVLQTVGENRVLHFSLKTEYCYKKDNSPVIEEVWHRVTAWESKDMPDFSLVKKGMTVYVLGRIRSQKFTGSDGVDRTSLEVLAKTLSIVEDEDYCQPQLR